MSLIEDSRERVARLYVAAVRGVTTDLDLDTPPSWLVKLDSLARRYAAGLSDSTVHLLSRLTDDDAETVLKTHIVAEMTGATPP